MNFVYLIKKVPVAPRGCPFEINPPLGFTTYLPPYVLSPLSTSSPPLPTKISNGKYLSVQQAQSKKTYDEESLVFLCSLT